MKLAQITPQQLNEADAGYDNTQDVRAAVLPYLENEINKLNRKAEKLGTPPIEMSVSEPFFKEEKEDGETVQQKYVTVTIEGEAPQVPGYEFLATIEHKGASGNIVRTMPGVSEANVKNFYDASPDYCDHCKKKRARIDTFIIKDQKTGDLRQIGRNCLADFLGGKDPKQVLFWFSLKQRISDVMSRAEDYEGKMTSRVEYGASKTYVMNVAAALVNKFGYKRAGSYDSTASQVRTVVFSPPTATDDYTQELRKIVKDGKDAAQAYAEKVLDWFMNDVSDADKQDNNFLHSIDVALKDNHITYRDAGFVAAMFPAYERAVGEKKAASTRSNQWVGNVGDKLPPTKIKVVATSLHDGMYGTTQRVQMEDGAGNMYTWWNTGKHDMEKGASYTIKGTIKKHDDYRGQKSTVLTRVSPRQE
jgi:hypothetical protein